MEITVLQAVLRKSICIYIYETCLVRWAYLSTRAIHCCRPGPILLGHSPGYMAGIGKGGGVPESVAPACANQYEAQVCASEGASQNLEGQQEYLTAWTRGHHQTCCPSVKLPSPNTQHIHERSLPAFSAYHSPAYKQRGLSYNSYSSHGFNPAVHKENYL